MNEELNKNNMKDFTDLKAWQEAHKLVLTIYLITKDFPKQEVFGLVSQMRRAAVSVASNLAEGFSRSSYKEKLQFYVISLGSLTELQSQLMISKDIDYLDKIKFSKIFAQSIIVHKIINGLIKGSKKYIK